MVAALQVVSVLFGAKAIALLAVGMMLKSWLIVDIHTIGAGLNVGVSLRVGLWGASVCQSGQSTSSLCINMSTSDFSRQDGNQLAVLIGDMKSLQLRMWIGLCFAVVAFLLLCQFVRRDKVGNIPQSSFGTASAIAWCLACVSVVSAVSAQVRQLRDTDQTYHAIIEMTRSLSAAHESQYTAQEVKQQFQYTAGVPWALLLCGFGAILCAVVQLTVALWICKRPKNEKDDVVEMLV